MILMFRHDALKLSAPIVAGLLGLSACSGSAASKASGSTDDNKPSIVVGAYPFAYVASQVAGDMAEVTNLLAPGADGHDLELTAKQVAQVGEADLVVYQEHYQEAMDEAVEQQSPGKVLETGSFLELLPRSGAGTHESEDDHDHESSSAEASEEDHHHKDHDHGAYDPHVWLAPTNVATIGDHVAKALGEIDPGNADAYKANATSLTEKMNALDGSYETGLATCEITTFITNHAAFGYLANRYHLTQVGISGISTEEEPSPARIQEIHEIAKANNVTTIFTETAVSPKVAEAIAGDLGIQTAVLDPLETLSDQSAGSDYAEVMSSNLESLRSANKCQ